jgi:cobalt/nickel transport system permease protein
VRKVSTLTFVFAGIAAAVALVIFVAPNANSNPDGLEKVAADTGIDADVSDHAMAVGPLADYGVEGVDNRYVGTWIAGLAGVAATFVIGAGLVSVARRTRKTSSPSRPSVTTRLSGG